LIDTHIYSFAFNTRGDIFVGSDGGVFRSTYNGNNWTAINDGLTNTNIRTLAINTSGYIFTGTTGRGVFRSLESTIPVELNSFTADVIENLVNLEWTTATETNNKGFEIQRIFSNSDWRKIGFVEGHGTTTEPCAYSYSDDISNINSNAVTYRFKQLDFDGSYQYSNEVIVENIAPQDFALYQNYPNPFNPVTTIEYNLPLKSLVTLIIYNSLGEKISQLVNEEIGPGYHQVPFNAANIPGGVYFYQLKSGSFVETKKMILLK